MLPRPSWMQGQPRQHNWYNRSPTWFFLFQKLATVFFSSSVGEDLSHTNYSCCYDGTLWPQATWGVCDLFGLHILSHTQSTEGSHGRNSNWTGTWRHWCRDPRERMLTGLLSPVSYRTQNHQPKVEPPTMNGPYYVNLWLRNWPSGLLAYSWIFGRHFLS